MCNLHVSICQSVRYLFTSIDSGNPKKHFLFWWTVNACCRHLKSILSRLSGYTHEIFCSSAQETFFFCLFEQTMIIWPSTSESSDAADCRTVNSNPARAPLNVVPSFLTLPKLMDSFQTQNPSKHILHFSVHVFPFDSFLNFRKRQHEAPRNGLALLQMPDAGHQWCTRWRCFKLPHRYVSD